MVPEMPRTAEYMTFLPLLQQRMDMLDYDLQQLAARAGIDKSTLGDNCRGDARMTINNFLKVCGALNLDIDSDTDAVEICNILQEIAKRFR